jgi:DNA-3-methyladenine glycosylase
MLLGCFVETSLDGELCRAAIVETEAYVGPHDGASHAHARFGVTRRNRVMFGPPGIAYVYRSYGIHWCLNAVTGDEGFPAAVLIRAARPASGLEVMRRRRGTSPAVDLLRGPGRLCRAMAIDGTLNAHLLDRPPLRFLVGSPTPDDQIAVGPRVGISRAVDLPLRFWIAGDPHVSRYRSDSRAARRAAAETEDSDE